MTRLALCVLAVAACSGGANSSRANNPAQRARAAPVLAALASGSFDQTAERATKVLAADASNSHAAAARALATYVTALSALRRETEAVLASAGDSFDHPRMRRAMEETLVSFAAVRADLVIASADPELAIELCLACWERDWNHSGEIDDRDRRFLEIEIDAAGEEFPPGDPRRRPTFRFDVGDIHWAQAMVSFQSAFFEIVLAYKWTELDKLLRAQTPPVIRIELESPDRIATARASILAGLAAAVRCRESYLAETDDDREWVPNPAQKSYPLPLPVDATLYATWKGVLDDLVDLVNGKTGLSVAELAQLGDHQWSAPPQGFVDLGRMLSDPKSIVLDLRVIVEGIERADDDERGPDAKSIEHVLSSVLGVYYVKSMKASPIISRLSRMKREIERDQDTFERKLRYLLWLN